MSTTSDQDRRPYRMRRRADAVDRTRQQIVEAAVALHTSVGPAQTTISAVAERAGVTRVTVYRHYPDEDSLFRDCTTHWAQMHPGPDVEAWAGIDDVRERASTAISELYAWYERNGEDLLPIHRDVASLPAAVQEQMQAESTGLVEILVRGVAPRGRARARLRAAAAHVIDLGTWRSLTATGGVSTEDAARLATAFLVAALEGGA